MQEFILMMFIILSFISMFFILPLSKKILFLIGSFTLTVGILAGCSTTNELIQDQNHDTEQQTAASDQERTNESVQQEQTDGFEEDSTVKGLKVQVISVTDGDTIAVVYKGNRESVRFLLVDTPETSHPRHGEQPYGKEAKEFTRNLVEKANKIELKFDIGPLRDKYGRLLAYVYADGKMLQEQLLKNGLARVAYIYPPNTRYVDQFNAIQKEAQQNGIGFWEIENYAQEDGFHSELKDKNETEDNQNNYGCVIKGNIGSEKIYHTPDSPWYEQTKAEVMFCTEEEAIEAGFRPPKQK